MNTENYLTNKFTIIFLIDNIIMGQTAGTPGKDGVRGADGAKGETGARGADGTSFTVLTESDRLKVKESVLSSFANQKILASDVAPFVVQNESLPPLLANNSTFTTAIKSKLIEDATFKKAVTPIVDYTKMMYCADGKLCKVPTTVTEHQLFGDSDIQLKKTNGKDLFFDNKTGGYYIRTNGQPRLSINNGGDITIPGKVTLGSAFLKDTTGDLWQDAQNSIKFGIKNNMIVQVTSDGINASGKSITTDNVITKRATLGGNTLTTSPDGGTTIFERSIKANGNVESGTGLFTNGPLKIGNWVISEEEIKDGKGGYLRMRNLKNKDVYYDIDPYAGGAKNERWITFASK